VAQQQQFATLQLRYRTLTTVSTVLDTKRRRNFAVVTSLLKKYKFQNMFHAKILRLLVLTESFAIRNFVNIFRIHSLARILCA
jgi:hypothetical protein